MRIYIRQLLARDYAYSVKLSPDQLLPSLVPLAPPHRRPLPNLSVISLLEGEGQ